jgi:hypothetical protein
LTELVDGSLTVLLGADDNDFSKVGDGSDHSCGEFNFSDGFINLKDIIARLVLFLNELFHVVIDLISSKVDLKLLSNVRWQQAILGCRFFIVLSSW